MGDEYAIEEPEVTCTRCKAKVSTCSICHTSLLVHQVVRCSGPAGHAHETCASGVRRSTLRFEA